MYLKGGSSFNNDLQKVLTLWSAVFSLNVAVAEPSRSESECQANLAVDTMENVIWGGEDLADGWQRARKQDEFDGSINFKHLIDGLLIKKGVSDSAKQAFHSGKSDIATVSGMPVVNRCARWNEE